MNRLDRWPYVHLCVVDWKCWRDFWRYGMPMRLHYKERFWEILGLLWLSNKIGERRWDWEHPVQINVGKRSNPNTRG